MLLEELSLEALSRETPDEGGNRRSMSFSASARSWRNSGAMAANGPCGRSGARPARKPCCRPCADPIRSSLPCPGLSLDAGDTDSISGNAGPLRHIHLDITRWVTGNLRFRNHTSNG